MYFLSSFLHVMVVFVLVGMRQMVPLFVFHWGVCYGVGELCKCRGGNN